MLVQFISQFRGVDSERPHGFLFGLNWMFFSLNLYGYEMLLTQGSGQYQVWMLEKNVTAWLATVVNFVFFFFHIV